MKKVISFLLGNLLLLSSAVFANYDTDYLAEDTRSCDPKLNVQVYIPSLLFGVFSGDVSVKVSDKLSLGPQMSSFSYGKYKGYSAGLTANYALSGNDVFGDRIWLLNPHIGYAYDNVFNSNSAKKGAITCGANLVYQWMWESGINTRVGVGINYSSSKPWNSISDSHFGGTALFSLGYAF